MELYQLTKQLEQNLDDLKIRYLNNEKPEDKRDRDFFSYVKEQTTPIYERIDQWEKLATAFVKDRSVSVHPQQIQSTSENMKLLLMHSYYIDARQRRYMELHQSVLYVFEMLYKDLTV